MTPKSWSFCLIGTYKIFHLPSSVFETWVIYTHFFMIKKKTHKLEQNWLPHQFCLLFTCLPCLLYAHWANIGLLRKKLQKWKPRERLIKERAQVVTKNKNLDNYTRRIPTKWISNFATWTSVFWSKWTNSHWNM